VKSELELVDWRDWGLVNKKNEIEIRQGDNTVIRRDSPKAEM
jgi:hypothetical protein